MPTTVHTLIDIFVTPLIKEGREFLHGKYPRDFELYVCALELVDADSNPIDYFIFPVNPKSINKTHAEATVIQHSLKGITVLNKDGYYPDDITIQGDFGRSFKLTMFGQDEYYKGLRYSVGDGYYSSNDVMRDDTAKFKVQELPKGIKSGYGCVKILQSILDKAKSRDQSGRTFKLYFHNQALGESYLVIPTRNPLTLSQNVSGSNMIWQYNMNLISIADLNDLDTSSSQVVKEKQPLNTYNILKSIPSQSSFMQSVSNYTVTNRR